MELTHSVYPHDGDLRRLLHDRGAHRRSARGGLRYLADLYTLAEWTFSMRDFEAMDAEGRVRSTDRIGGATKIYTKCVANADALHRRLPLRVGSGRQALDDLPHARRPGAAGARTSRARSSCGPTAATPSTTRTRSRSSARRSQDLGRRFVAVLLRRPLRSRCRTQAHPRAPLQERAAAEPAPGGSADGALTISLARRRQLSAGEDRRERLLRRSRRRPPRDVQGRAPPSPRGRGRDGRRHDRAGRRASSSIARTSIRRGTSNLVLTNVSCPRHADARLRRAAHARARLPAAADRRPAQHRLRLVRLHDVARADR